MRPMPRLQDTRLTAWESVTPNIHIGGTHLAAFGAVSPLAGSQWHATTTGHALRFTPTWAIVMCILFIWVCLLGLLFLAVKRERVGEGDGHCAHS